MTIIGYARVSTTDQDLEIQITALKREGCHTIRSEKRSGTTTEGREELRTVLDFLREGDVLMVTRIDRLARSIGDLQDRGFIEGDRAADRHQHRGRQVFFGHARRVRRIRDEPAARAPARRDRQGQGGRRVQGAAGVDRCGPGARDEGAGESVPRRSRRPSRSAGRRFTGCWKPAERGIPTRRGRPCPQP
jgi:hypothetical protein